MGIIKEPQGVDFIIQSPPLTEKEKKEISAFISESKKKNALRKVKRVSKPKQA